MEGTVMTKKSLIVGVVTLCALPVAGHAQVLLNENFNEQATTPGTGLVVGPVTIGDFTALRFRILGPAGTSPHCRAPLSGNCLLLNGGASPNSLTSKKVTLEPGVSYFLSFDAIGNPNASNNMLTVTLGPGGSLFDKTIPLATGSSTFTEDQLIRVSTMETADLVFRGSGTIGANGPIIDNIVLEVPEPATLGLMALGLLGGAVAGFARCKRPN
jgi:hypothetical protein